MGGVGRGLATGFSSAGGALAELAAEGAGSAGFGSAAGAGVEGAASAFGAGLGSAWAGSGVAGVSKGGITTTPPHFRHLTLVAVRVGGMFPNWAPQDWQVPMRSVMTTSTLTGRL
ncbi:MAG: hypothetical protein DWQ01_11660 [Planctomycetota bacterium]|nr:MAG: hypothetical protein DWQ01_11660 [Planctomycetota bacterium]